MRVVPLMRDVASDIERQFPALARDIGEALDAARMAECVSTPCAPEPINWENVARQLYGEFAAYSAVDPDGADVTPLEWFVSRYGGRP